MASESGINDICGSTGEVHAKELWEKPSAGRHGFFCADCGSIWEYRDGATVSVQLAEVLD